MENNCIENEKMLINGTVYRKDGDLKQAAYILNKINKLDPEVMLKIINTRFAVSDDKAELFAQDDEIICGRHDGKVTISTLSIINSILSLIGSNKVTCTAFYHDNSDNVYEIEQFDFLYNMKPVELNKLIDIGKITLQSGTEKTLYRVTVKIASKPIRTVEGYIRYIENEQIHFKTTDGETIVFDR